MAAQWEMNFTCGGAPYSSQVCSSAFDCLNNDTNNENDD